MSMVKNEDFKIIKGKDKLHQYQFHSKIAKHFFCSICGIYTHHNPRANPAMTGFNIGCVDDIDVFKLMLSNPRVLISFTNSIYITSVGLCLNIFFTSLVLLIKLPKFS